MRKIDADNLSLSVDILIIAALAVRLEPMFAAEAKERQGTRHDLNITQKFAGSSGESREQAASATGTNRQYVSDAKRIHEHAQNATVME